MSYRKRTVSFQVNRCCILVQIMTQHCNKARQWLWWKMGQLLNPFNTLRRRQNGRHFPDDIFKWIFLNENVWISINISLKFVPRGPITNIPTLVQVMAWRRPGDKPLSEPMMVRLPTHIRVTQPQWVNTSHNQSSPPFCGAYIVIIWNDHKLPRIHCILLYIWNNLDHWSKHIEIYIILLPCPSTPESIWFRVIGH